MTIAVMFKDKDVSRLNITNIAIDAIIPIISAAVDNIGS